MRKRFVHNRGAAAVVVIVLVLLLVLAGAGYWFYSKGGGIGVKSSAFDMAGHLPKTAKVAWMIDMRGQADPEEVKEDVKEIIAQMPEDERKKMDEDLKKELGVTFDELASLFDGRAASAVLEQAGKPGAVALVGLKDVAGFEKMVKAKTPPNSKTEAVGGVTFTFTPEGQCWGNDKTWVYLADSKASAELLVASAAGKEPLSGLPMFVEARDRAAGSSSLAAFYWDIASSVKAMQAVQPPIPYTDAQTYKDLACLQYAVGNMDLKGGMVNLFLKVLDDKSTLSAKLLAKGSVTPASFGAMTKNTNQGLALDLEWTFNTLVQLSMLSPQTREYGSALPAGLAMIGNPFNSFDGEIAFTSNTIELFGPLMGENFSTARAQGQFTACKSNLKNIGTACEMYSTDYQGKYPANLTLLTPNYLKTIPQCPAAGSDTYSSTFKSTANPDYYEVACSGNHHQQASDNLPSYNCNEGLNPGTEIGGPDKPEPQPSVVVTAGVKDPVLAHALLAKGLPDAGAEPKPPEEKVYKLPEGTLVMKTATPARLIFGYGDKTADLLDTKGGTLADKARLKEALDWGKEGIVYADYLNLNPLVAEFGKALPKEDTPEAKMARALYDKAKDLDLEGASCLAVRPDGLHWRAYGSTTGFAAAGAVGAAIMVPNFIRARGQGQATACKSNLKNIGTAMEMYSTDYQGKYPPNMSYLTPNYLKTIPECPAAATVTYTAYMGKNAKGNPDHYNDYYYVECKGANHVKVGLPPDFPAYNGIMGLIEGP